MKWDYTDEVGRRLAEEQQLRNNMRPWLDAAKEVSDWLVPSRGVFNVQSKPKRRILTPTKVVNPYAKHAFGVMTSGLKEGIAPSTRPWFDQTFVGEEARNSHELKVWLEQAKKIFYQDIRRSNFYNRATSYIKEVVAFGTGSWGIFSGKETPYTFHVMTFGEFAIGADDAGNVDRMYRTIFLNIHQMMKKFGENLPENILEMIENKDTKLDYWYTVIEGTVPEKFLDMPYTRFYILLGDEKRSAKGGGGVYGKVPEKNMYRDFLSVEGANEFPYPTTRWDTSGSDECGVGPGHESVPVIKRMQEVVKSGMVAYHKSVLPPLNVPIHLKGIAGTAPNAHNYYTDPEQIIRPVQDIRFDHASAERAEGVFTQALQEIFYNDVFLTASRDANASPLKARQVDEIASDRIVRIGPQLGQLFFEGFAPALNRAFAIGLRDGRFPDLPEQFQGKKLDMEITFTSVLAQALKAAGALPVTRYLQTMGGIAQFDEEVMDLVDIDKVGVELADIEGVTDIVLRSPADVKQRRVGRAQARQAEQEAMQKAQGQEDAAAGAQVQNTNAATMKTMSEAGANLSDTLTDGFEL